MKNKTFVYWEPSISGGSCETTVTGEQILDYMRNRHPRKDLYREISDNDCIFDFTVIHWAVEKKDVTKTN